MPDLPADVGTGWVRVRLRSMELLDPATGVSEVSAASGRVIFTPSASTMRHVGDGLIIPSTPVSVFLDASGNADVELMATNDPQIQPYNFTYEVSFDLEDGLKITPFHISVPEGSDYELSDIMPMPDASGVYYAPGPPGPQGPPGPPGTGTGPMAISADAGNYATLGTDTLIYVPTPDTVITDHGGLTGLADDDHPQYHDDTRGDVRYYTKAQIDTNLYTRTQVDTNTYTRAQTDSAIAAATSTTNPYLVVKYTGGSYPTLPTSKPAGVTVVQFYGPTAPVSVPSWVGLGPTQALGEYIYAALT